MTNPIDTPTDITVHTPADNGQYHYVAHKFIEQGTGDQRYIPVTIDKKSLDETYNTTNRKYLGKGSGGLVFKCKAYKELPSVVRKTWSGTLLERNPVYQKSHEGRSKNKLYAIKTMKECAKIGKLRERGAIEETCLELVFIHNMPSHPNIVQILDVFADISNFDQYQIVMEPMETSLADLIYSPQNNDNLTGKRALSITTIKGVMKQIVAGVDHIHKNGFIHHDLKSDNILISRTNKYFGLRSNPDVADAEMESFNDDELVVKITDFGLSCRINNKHLNNGTSGTLTYYPPEKCLRLGNYTPAVDIWGIGCILLELIYQEVPFLPDELVEFQSKNDSILLLEGMNKYFGSPYLQYRNMRWFECNLFGIWGPAGDFLRSKRAANPHVTVKGHDFQELRKESEYVFQFLTAAMQWNPSNRASAETLLKMSVFTKTEGTSIISQCCKSRQVDFSFTNINISGFNVVDWNSFKKVICCFGNQHNNTTKHDSSSQGIIASTAQSKLSNNIITEQPVDGTSSSSSSIDLFSTDRGFQTLDERRPLILSQIKSHTGDGQVTNADNI